MTYILLNHIFDNSHCVNVTCVNEYWFASDFGHLLAISQNLSGEWKIRAKIVQCELGICANSWIDYGESKPPEGSNLLYFLILLLLIYYIDSSSEVNIYYCYVFVWKKCGENFVVFYGIIQRCLGWSFTEF